MAALMRQEAEGGALLVAALLRCIPSGAHTPSLSLKGKQACHSALNQIWFNPRLLRCL